MRTLSDGLPRSVLDLHLHVRGRSRTLRNPCAERVVSFPGHPGQVSQVMPDSIHPCMDGLGLTLGGVEGPFGDHCCRGGRPPGWCGREGLPGGSLVGVPPRCPLPRRGSTHRRPRSRRPRASPRALPDATVELIIGCRRDLIGQGLDGGPDTIAGSSSTAMASG